MLVRYTCYEEKGSTLSDEGLDPQSIEAIWRLVNSELDKTEERARATDGASVRLQRMVVKDSHDGAQLDAIYGLLRDGGPGVTPGKTSTMRLGRMHLQVWDRRAELKLAISPEQSRRDYVFERGCQAVLYAGHRRGVQRRFTLMDDDGRSLGLVWRPNHDAWFIERQSGWGDRAASLRSGSPRAAINMCQ